MLLTGKTVIFELQCVLYTDDASIYAKRFWKDAHRLQ